MTLRLQRDDLELCWVAEQDARKRRSESTLRQPFSSRLFDMLSKYVDVRVELDEQYGYVGRVYSQSSAVAYFDLSNIDVNRQAAAAVARDKQHAGTFLAEVGLPVLPAKRFYSEELSRFMRRPYDLLWRYQTIEGLANQIVVRPNDGYDGRRAFIVENSRDFCVYAAEVLKVTQVGIAQPYVPGIEFRVVVLDGEVKLTYRKSRPSIIGNGRDSIGTLIENLVNKRRSGGFQVRISPDDDRILCFLQLSRMDLETVPADGESITFLATANGVSGGTLEDVSDAVHDRFREDSVKACERLGLRYGGVDFISTCDLNSETGDYAILEVDPSPNLRFYAGLGRREWERVLELHLDLLELMTGAKLK